jgi:hypothetical protein
MIKPVNGYRVMWLMPLEALNALLLLVVVAKLGFVGAAIVEVIVVVSIIKARSYLSRRNTKPRRHYSAKRYRKGSQIAQTLATNIYQESAPQ